MIIVPRSGLSEHNMMPENVIEEKYRAELNSARFRFVKMDVISDYCIARSL